MLLFDEHLSAGFHNLCVFLGIASLLLWTFYILFQSTDAQDAQHETKKLQENHSQPITLDEWTVFHKDIKNLSEMHLNSILRDKNICPPVPLPKINLPIQIKNLQLNTQDNQMHLKINYDSTQKTTATIYYGIPLPIARAIARIPPPSNNNHYTHDTTATRSFFDGQEKPIVLEPTLDGTVHVPLTQLHPLQESYLTEKTIFDIQMHAAAEQEQQDNNNNHHNHHRTNDDDLESGNRASPNVKKPVLFHHPKAPSKIPITVIFQLENPYTAFFEAQNKLKRQIKEKPPSPFINTTPQSTTQDENPENNNNNPALDADSVHPTAPAVFLGALTSVFCTLKSPAIDIELITQLVHGVGSVQAALEIRNLASTFRSVSAIETFYDKYEAPKVICAPSKNSKFALTTNGVADEVPFLVTDTLTWKGLKHRRNAKQKRTLTSHHHHQTGSNSTVVVPLIDESVKRDENNNNNNDSAPEMPLLVGSDNDDESLSSSYYYYSNGALRLPAMVGGVIGPFEYNEIYGPGDERECPVCFDNLVNVMLIPCRHLALCTECLKEIRQDKCPLCRAEFSSFVRFPVVELLV